MLPVALEAEDGLMVSGCLVEFESSKQKGFDFHGVADELSTGFYFDDGVVGSHVIECRQVVRFGFYVVDHVSGHLLSVHHLRVEFAIMGGYDAVEIHIIFSKSARFIEASELDDATSDDFILGNTENLFFVESFQCVDNSEGHRDWKGGWDCDENDVNEFDEDVRSGLIVDVNDDNADIRSNCNEEEEEKEFGALPLEAVFLFLWEKNDANKLSLCCYEVSPYNANWNAILFAVCLKFLHFFLVAHLHDGCSFEHKGIFIDFSWI